MQRQDEAVISGRKRGNLKSLKLAKFKVWDAKLDMAPPSLNFVPNVIVYLSTLRATHVLR